MLFLWNKNITSKRDSRNNFMTVEFQLTIKKIGKKFHGKFINGLVCPVRHRLHFHYNDSTNISRPSFPQFPFLRIDKNNKLFLKIKEKYFQQSTYLDAPWGSTSKKMGEGPSKQNPTVLTTVLPIRIHRPILYKTKQILNFN